MQLSELGRDIHEYQNIDRVFPKKITMTLDEHSELSADLDDVQGVVFPAHKLMWPVCKTTEIGTYLRTDAVRSVNATQYSPSRIFRICIDHTGAWMFIKHESKTTNVVGFVATLTDVLVQPFGNVPPVEIYKWMQNQSYKMQTNF